MASARSASSVRPSATAFANERAADSTTDRSRVIGTSDMHDLLVDIMSVGDDLFDEGSGAVRQELGVTLAFTRVCQLLPLSTAERPDVHRDLVEVSVPANPSIQHASRQAVTPELGQMTSCRAGGHPEQGPQV